MDFSLWDPIQHCLGTRDSLYRKVDIALSTWWWDPLLLQHTILQIQRICDLGEFFLRMQYMPSININYMVLCPQQIEHMGLQTKVQKQKWPQSPSFSVNFLGNLWFSDILIFSLFGFSRIIHLHKYPLLDCFRESHLRQDKSLAFQQCY